MISLLFLLLLAICMVAGIVLMNRGYVMYKDPSKSRMQFLISNLIIYVPRQIIIILTIRYFYVIGWGSVSILIGIFEFFLHLFFSYSLIGKTASPSFRNHSERFSVFFLLNLILFAFWVGPRLAFEDLSEVYLFQYNYFNGYTYEVDTDEITIVNYSGGEKDIVIPSVIEGKPVTQIAAFGFNEQTGLTSVTVPGSVRSIGNSAFESCRSLHTVTISEGVTSIDVGAFAYCNSLTSVTLPDSVSIINENPFKACAELTEINVSSENSEFSSIDGILYTKNLDKIIAYPGGREGDFIIPDSVKDLGIGAFLGCEELNSVTISGNVRTISDRAFFGCSSLQEIIIAEGVTSIGDDAFYNCNSLISIEIPAGVTEIGQDTFGGCENITSVTIPDSVTSIGYSTFPDNGILVIHCGEGSYAEAYAKVIKITYALVE